MFRNAAIQLYVAYPEAAAEPPKLLRAFEKVELAAGESRVVTLPVFCKVLLGEAPVYSGQAILGPHVIPENPEIGIGDCDQSPDHSCMSDASIKQNIAGFYPLRPRAATARWRKPRLLTVGLLTPGTVGAGGCWPCGPFAGERGGLHGPWMLAAGMSSDTPAQSRPGPS